MTKLRFHLFFTLLACVSIAAAGGTPADPSQGGLRFTSTPPYSGVVGVEYYYDADAVAGDPSHLIHYRGHTLPAGATIDSVTGELRFTAAVPGKVVFQITAYLVSDPSITGTQAWHVLFGDSTGHQGCGVLAGTVVDQNGSPMSGKAWVKKAGDSTGQYILAPIDNGVFTVPVPDSALYVIKVTGSHFVTEWYQDAGSEAAATPVLVRCGDSVVVSITVQTLSTKTISGRVRSATDSSEIGTAKVVALSANGAMYYAMMDPATGYTLSLPEGIEYILYAMDPAGGYQTMYYDNVADKSLATTILLTTNLTGIDFYLPEFHAYRNALQGAVTDSAGQGLTAVVKLYRIHGTGQSQTAVKVAFAVTDSSGTGAYAFAGLEPGEYILYAIPHSHDYIPGYYLENGMAVPDWLQATRVTVDTAGVVSDIIIRLPRKHGLTGGGVVNGTITARVGGFTGGSVPLPEATAIVYDAAGRASAYAISDADGAFEIRDCPEGTVTLFTGLAGYQSSSVQLQIPANSVPVNGSVELQPLALVSAGELPGAPELRFTLHPNPSAGVATATWASPAATSLILSVYNSLGERVRQSVIGAGARTVVVDLGLLPAGVYHAVLSGGGARSATKTLLLVR